MISSFIITFRETLEAALIVGIVLSYLVKTRQTTYLRTVYAAIISGVVASIIGAVLFNSLAGGFTGRAEEIFEGVTMLIGAFLLTTMILWMLSQKHIASELENKVSLEINEAHKIGLFSLVFVSVLREGIETVIFLGAANFASADNNPVGLLAGIFAAILVGYGIFAGSMKMNLKKFFNATSILLILFAAGLVAGGVHGLQEAGILPEFVEHVWDVNPQVNQDGSYPLLHEKGYFGGLLHDLFGYRGDPSLMEVLGYLTYLALAVVLWKNTERH
ncbi:MAG: FTR1 family protein [Candidatus Altiarchaeota archaeon]